MSHACESCDIGEHSNDCQRHHQYQHRIKSGNILEYTAEQGSETCQNHTLRALHKSNLALNAQTFGAGTHIAHHQRTDQGNKRNDSVNEIVFD